MLILPKNWRLFTGGAVFTDLFGQVPEGELRREAAKHIIGACLDLAAVGISKRSHSPLTVKYLPDLVWRIGDYTYLYFHDIDNKALAWATELGVSFFGSIVVPPAHEEILWRACLQVLGKRTPSIIALDNFVNLRTLFSSPDFGWLREQVVLDLLRRYNRHVADATYDTAILVDIPSE